MKARQLNRSLHRDMGYFFAGIIILYGVSGLAVNHRDQWNPDFVVDSHPVMLDLPQQRAEITDQDVHEAVAGLKDKGTFRSYGFPSDERIKIYFDDGAIMAGLADGRGEYETVRRRPLLYRFNFLHLHPAGWWRLFADIFAVSLVLMALTGLVILQGRNSVAGRGKWFLTAGILVPLMAIFLT